eukprot:12422665-Karenia_brevis.AAC.1
MQAEAEDKRRGTSSVTAPCCSQCSRSVAQASEPFWQTVRDDDADDDDDDDAGDDKCMLRAWI